MPFSAPERVQGTKPQVNMSKFDREHKALVLLRVEDHLDISRYCIGPSLMAYGEVQQQYMKMHCEHPKALKLRLSGSKHPTLGC